MIIFFLDKDLTFGIYLCTEYMNRKKSNCKFLPSFSTLNNNTHVNLFFHHFFYPLVFFLPDLTVKNESKETDMETKENTTIKEVSPPPPPAPQLDPKIPTPPPLTAAPSIIAQNKNNHPNLFLKTSPFQSFGSGHFLPSESVYESAAKLLFMSIKWARSVPSFLQLNDSDQTLLLEDSWAQLFVIGLAQWSIQFDEGDFYNDIVIILQYYFCKKLQLILHYLHY